VLTPSIIEAFMCWGVPNYVYIDRLGQWKFGRAVLAR
jgi:hypothetical protein